MRGAGRDLQLIEVDASKSKMSDFEEWLFWQSNVMLDQNLEHQKKRYAADKAWHGRSEMRPYRSKA